MSDTNNMKDILSNYVSKEEFLTETLYGEGSILIDAYSLESLNNTMPYSVFDMTITEKVYIAGIKHVELDDFFVTVDKYDGFLHTGSKWSPKVVDTEKSNRDNDNLKCWAATDSNLLYRTGWLTSEDLTEDDLFSKFQSSFIYGSTCTGFITDGIDWYLTGHYSPPVTIGIDQCLSGTGAYFSSSVSSQNLQSYLSTGSATCGSYLFFEEAIMALKAGKSVGLGVFQYRFNPNYTVPERAGHAITLQGYSYELVTENDNEYEKITGLIIVDSDDDRSSGCHSELEPNVLVYIPIHYLYGYVYLDLNYHNYMSSGWSPTRIESTTILSPADYSILYFEDEPVSSAATLINKKIGSGESMDVFQYGLAANTEVTFGGRMTVYTGGSASLVQVHGGGEMTVSYAASVSSGVQIGGKMDVVTYANFSSANVVYQLDVNTPENDPLITNLSNMGGVSTLGLNVNRMENFGSYILASNGGNFNSNGTVVVTDITNNSSLLSLHDWSHSSCSAGAKTYTLDYAGGVMTLNISGTKADQTTPCDFHYNGISDVIYISGGTEGQTIRYGLSGTSEFQDEGIHDPDMRIVGGYDMDWDHRVDLVTCRSIEIDSTDCLVIEYAQSGDLNDVQEIDIINNSGNVNWNIYCGNLTGHDWKNSILWHAPDLGILGYWADAGGNASWGTIGNVYDSNWEVLGLGDFSNDSVHKDAVLFQYNCSAIVEITASGGYRSLGTLGSGWEVAAIGDFSNDGVDDLILYNTSSGMVGKWADGVDTGWSSLGTVGTGTSIEGAGDYDGNGTMDLLARQSDGTMGYYASANLSQFTSFGYTMDSSWTVIA